MNWFLCADRGQEYIEDVAPRRKVNNGEMGQEKGGVLVDGSENGPVPRLDNAEEDDSAMSDELNGTKINHDAVGQEKSELVIDGAENGIVSKAGDTGAKKADELDVSASLEEQNGAPKEEAAPPEGEPEEGSEAFQMRMAAESIMNVLDITMPGTLTDEKKHEVDLTCLGQFQLLVAQILEEC